jgi:hypothetical protein
MAAWSSFKALVTFRRHSLLRSSSAHGLLDRCFRSQLFGVLYYLWERHR